MSLLAVAHAGRSRWGPLLENPSTLLSVVRDEDPMAATRAFPEPLPPPIEAHRLDVEGHVGRCT
jgi:hypothetical protein